MKYPIYYNAIHYKHDILNAETYGELDMIVRAIRNTFTISEDDKDNLLEFAKEFERTHDYVSRVYFK